MDPPHFSHLNGVVLQGEFGVWLSTQFFLSPNWIHYQKWSFNYLDLFYQFYFFLTFFAVDIVYSKNSRTQGLKNSGTQGLEDSRTQELKDSWTHEFMDSRTHGLKDSRTQGPKDPKTQGPKDSRTQGLGIMNKGLGIRDSRLRIRDYELRTMHNGLPIKE